MSERGDFEANELRGLAKRYGGERVEVMPSTEHHPAVHAYQFSPLCWCCPMYQHQELVLAEGADRSDWRSWSCPKGCARSMDEGALKNPCAAGIIGHHGVPR